MRHDGGDFGRVVGEGEKAAGDENIAGRQGEGVDGLGCPPASEAGASFTRTPLR
jgi:hypothetical protein